SCTLNISNISKNQDNETSDYTNDEKSTNAVRSANTFWINYLATNYPSFLLRASSTSVGLLPNQIGNSEVGHLTIGAGRVVEQPITRICYDALEKKLAALAYKNNFRFFTNNSPINLNQVNRESLKISYSSNKSMCVQNNVHMIAMFSDTGVHSHIDHVKDLMNILEKKDATVNVHAISDGIDTLKRFSEFIEMWDQQDIKKIKSLAGRMYAMDRSGNQELTMKYFNCITNNSFDINNSTIPTISVNTSHSVKSNSVSHIRSQRGYIGDSKNTVYSSPVTRNKTVYVTEFLKTNEYKTAQDEYIKPTLFDTNSYIKDKEIVIFVNFRADRMKQIYTLFTQTNCKTMTMTDYGVPSQNNLILFENTIVKNSLGEVLDRYEIQQLRLAENEKKFHVTYFLNGLRDQKFNTETHLFFDSASCLSETSKKNNTSDENDTIEKRNTGRKVEMSIFKLFDHLIHAMASDEKNPNKKIIVCNFANCDVFGHIGSFKKTKQSIDLIDACIGMIYQNIKKYKYKFLITADHGNAEEMVVNGKINKKHTDNLVPFIIVDTEAKKATIESDKLQQGGSLVNVAPTILDILNIPKPKEMTGVSLLKKH
ncbi:2,3-bisphosphoglycerate-independent phosphoglycerate mutase, partial [Cucumispora dikerogammari]